MAITDRERAAVVAEAAVLAGNARANVWACLNAMASILGTNKRALWPCWENGAVSTVKGYAATALTSRDEAAARNISAEWFPRVLRAQPLYAYFNEGSTNNHFTAGDDAAYSFTDGSDDDEAFSVGGWFAPHNVTTVALLAKYGNTANAEEWAFRINSASKLQLELHDASASASEIGVGEDAIELYKMQFFVATYDGEEASPAVKFYVDGVHDGGSGATTETGSYVGMENTAAALMIGAEDAVGAPANEYTGWLTLPFATGKRLSDTEVFKLYTYSRALVGA